jgi:hypothetical protein
MNMFTLFAAVTVIPFFSPSVPSYWTCIRGNREDTASTTHHRKGNNHMNMVEDFYICKETMKGTQNNKQQGMAIHASV